METYPEKVEIIREIEPYLTFLNVHRLEIQGADLQCKIEELEEVNQALRNQAVIYDTISYFSDQLVAYRKLKETNKYYVLLSV